MISLYRFIITGRYSLIPSPRRSARFALIHGFTLSGSRCRILILLLLLSRLRIRLRLRLSPHTPVRPIPVGSGRADVVIRYPLARLYSADLGVGRNGFVFGVGVSGDDVPGVEQAGEVAEEEEDDVEERGEGAEATFDPDCFHLEVRTEDGSWDYCGGGDGQGEYEEEGRW